MPRSGAWGGCASRVHGAGARGKCGGQVHGAGACCCGGCMGMLRGVADAWGWCVAWLVRGAGVCGWCVLLVRVAGACGWCVRQICAAGACVGWCVRLVCGAGAWGWCVGLRRGAGVCLRAAHLGHRVWGIMWVGRSPENDDSSCARQRSRRSARCTWRPGPLARALVRLDFAPRTTAKPRAGTAMRGP